MTEAAPVRASLTYKDPDEGPAVEFSFNPTEYSMTASTSWKQTPAKGKGSPKSEYTGNNAKTLTMDVLFVDNWAGRDQDVQLALIDLLLMTEPSTKSVSKDKPSAPVLLFRWGKRIPFLDCHLKSATIKFQMFNAEGDVSRATATIVLEEILAETPRQNPTSGGPAGSRAHVVSDGDSLASIAFREYDDAALWRGLADLNGIDDPMGLRVGQRLIVPPYEQAAARS